MGNRKGMNPTSYYMKGTFFSSLALLATLATAGADIIAQWTFNDTNAPATAPLPAVGAGTASLIGGTTALYVTGATADQGGTNKAWSIKGYPAKDVGNKTAGLQLNVSTVKAVAQTGISAGGGCVLLIPVQGDVVVTDGADV